VCGNFVAAHRGFRKQGSVQPLARLRRASWIEWETCRICAPAAWLVPKLCRKLCRELCRLFEEAHKKVCKVPRKTGARSPEGGTPAHR
jgi:hypothetical protein